MIKQMKYPGYFCITWDFIRHAREQGIPVGPGRGSAAGSFVAYCLRITDVDPMAYDLIFERFLNPERVSLPDIDIDFCERRRGEVIEYVTRKYGRENVAQIITFGTMKARAVVRDVARVMDIPYADADRVAKAVPPALDMTLAKALEESPPLKELQQKDPRIKELLEVAQRLEGMTRHASVHAAGVVIAPRPLTEFIPLYKSQKDEIVTQWAMKEVERVGLLKMDFLGLSTLTLISDALAEIKRTEGIDLDIDAIPLDDAKTYKLFGDGQTYGVFQFESSGMRELLRKAKPERLDDLIALNALYRPGPLKSGMVDDFISRKQGKTEVKYELPQLAPILGDTYGVIAYQEQVMRIAAVLAGFSMGQSDVLRKAMGKKDPKVMAKQREAFMDGARKNGVNEKKATKIFDLMEFFAGYGFNKSHSTTYAWVAYQTGYLKANYPWHFMSALLTIEAANTDKLAMYLGECRELGIPILPPDINTQPARLRRREGRRPLRLVRGEERRRGRHPLDAHRAQGARPHRLAVHAVRARRSAARQQAAARKPGQGRRVRLARRRTRSRPPRLSLRRRRQGDRARRPLSAQSRKRQVSFFDLPQDEDGAARPIPLPDAAPWSEAQQLAFEKEALGLYMSGHPLERFAEELKTFGAKRVARAGRAPKRTSGSAGSCPACGRSRPRRATGCASSCSTTSPAASRWSSSRRRSASTARWSRPTRCSWSAASSKKTTSRRASSPPSCCRSPRSRSGPRARSSSTCRAGRRAARPSRRWPSSSPGIAATAASSSSWTSRARRSRCACAPKSPSGSAPRSGWSSKSSRFAAQVRWN